MNYTEFLRDPSIFYVALVAFMVSVLVDLYIRTRKAKHEDNSPLSHRMEKALAHFKGLKANTRITNDKYQKVTKTSHSTATRDLQKMEELGIIEEQGTGRGTYYRLM